MNARIKSFSIGLTIAATLTAGGVASAGSPSAPPDYGMNFVTIGHAGNRLPTSKELPLGANYGSVDYEYRIMETPVTVGMWWEFVQAYALYTDDSSQAFTSGWILRDFEGNLYPPADVALQYPADMSFRYAARFVNWLHNGKGSDRASFENGVYDTSTFTQNPDGTFNDQSVRNSGSKYWIPTIDEWTKANHYDPNRYGPGQEGYWLYPDGGNEPLIPGLPENGGETDAGTVATQGPSYVGSYPWSESPLGLLDASGGLQEWTSSDSGGGRRFLPDSAQTSGLPEFLDRLDWLTTQWPSNGGQGFRIASAVPTPSTLPVLIAVVAYSRRRNRWITR